MIPFQSPADAVAGVFVEHNPRDGVPHWLVATMIKILFVQKCFGMFDPMAGEMLLDRICFRRFVGHSFDDKTPDHATIWLFRERLIKHGHISMLFDKQLQTLRGQSLVLNNGTR